MAKNCKKCKIHKDIEEFYKRGDKKGGGYQSHCKVCVAASGKTRLQRPEVRQRRRELMRKYRAKESERVVRLNHKSRIQQTYGITLEQYDQMAIDQNYVCKICKQPEIKQRLAIDHDHETGQVRGLLCRSCNIGLGHFKDSIFTLVSAAEYLKEYVS